MNTQNNADGNKAGQHDKVNINAPTHNNPGQQGNPNRTQRDNDSLHVERDNTGSHMIPGQGGQEPRKNDNQHEENNSQGQGTRLDKE